MSCHSYGATTVNKALNKDAPNVAPISAALGINKESCVIVDKDKSGLSFLIAVMVILPIYIHSYVVWKAGLSSVAFNLHLYIFPFSVLFFLLAYNIFRSLKKRVIISESGILVEDFSPVEFPWKIVNRASIKSQLLPRGGACHWLVLHTNCDAEYANRKVLKPNKIVGINGVPVCNLASYKGNAENVIAAINARAENA